jgi:aryl-alcohol dehydrogenase-like predicted oxidoreductase
LALFAWHREIPDHAMPFKGSKTFGTGEHFTGLSSTLARALIAAAQWKLLPMSTPTKMSIRLMVEVGISSFPFSGFLILKLNTNPESTMAIEHTRLGRHGVFVSNLCLGTMNFGWHTNEEESFKIMDRALELGINFFDTADVYGWDGEQGDTEEILGRWFAQGGGRREAVVLATKVFGAVKRKANLPEFNTDSRNLSAYKIRKHCEASLRRLQTDHIDLYQMHHVDRDCPWDEIWQAFEQLGNQGKVVYVGSSNFAGWDIATACQEASRQGLMGLCSEQSIYHLNNRTVELEVIPACRYYGLGLIPWSPLGGGLLGGALEKLKSGRRASEDALKEINENRAKLERYEALCKQSGEPPAAIALAWLLHNPIVTAPIIGPRTIEQLESALRATEIRLDDSMLKKLDEIFPGPGGEAPRAYAW